MATGGEGGEFNLSDESFDVCCTICSKKKLNKQAISYCTDCNKYLCDKCVQIHEEHSEGHKLVDLKDADQGSVLTEKCDKHKEEIIKLFCVDHDNVVCGLCGLLDHRKCQDLKHITDCVEDLEKDQKTERALKQLKSALHGTEQVIDALDQHLEKLSQREQKFLQEIEAYTTKILSKIEDMKANAVKEVTTKREQLETSAFEKKEACLMMKEDISKKLEDMKASKQRKANLFVLIKRGEALTKNMETLCRESKDLMNESRLAFTSNREIEYCLSKFTSLGNVNEKYEATLKGKADVSVKHDRNKSCNIEGCCLLQDGTVLLVDDKNKRIKHFNPSSCTITDHCELGELEGALRGITLINPKEVAVGTLGSHALRIVSLGNKLSHKSTLRLNHDCHRLVQSRGELFVTYRDTVYVQDMTRKLLRTICQDKLGQKMFKDICGIAVDSTEDRVYVTDWHKGLISVDREGRERFRRSLEELGLSSAFGVCTDNAGNVFVCGYRSNNVVQVSEDGRVLGEILSETQSINSPRCVCFDPDTNTLYVGGNTTQLLMFNLKLNTRDTLLV